MNVSDGVWFATGGDILTDLVEPRFHEVRTNQVRITNIRVNADLDALDKFTKSDIAEGAKVGYIGQPVQHEWHGGRMVPRW